MRVELEALHLLLKRCVDQLQQETFDTARWLDHRVVHVDGSSFSMPHTPELQAHFGQPGQQKPGCGFPVAHWLVKNEFRALKTTMKMDALKCKRSTACCANCRRSP